MFSVILKPGNWSGTDQQQRKYGFHYSSPIVVLNCGVRVSKESDYWHSVPKIRSKVCVTWRLPDNNTTSPTATTDNVTSAEDLLSADKIQTITTVITVITIS